MTILNVIMVIFCNILICRSITDIGSKIYFTINSYQPCVQLANATHQIGCTSDMKGNRGVLYIVNDTADIDSLIKGPHHPYVPLIDEPLFTNETMVKLIESKKISGALVALKNSSKTLQSFSPDPTCPLDNFGLYKGDPTYGDCKKRKWNVHGNGMSMMYYGIPIFALTDKEEIRRIVKCSLEHNYKNINAKTYPLCGIEMKDFMFAAKDTPTCKRKSEMANPILSTYCDPLGDYNVIGTLNPMVENLKSKSVVMVSTKLDSTAFFHDIAPGADNGVTGIVTLLAVARALGDYKRSILKNGTLKEIEDLKKLNPIMFIFFNGEIWDYIGSSRMVWDMQHGKFPYPEERKDIFNGTIDDSSSVSKVNMSHIGYFLELSQLGLGEDGEVFAHSDPISQRSKGVKSKVDQIIESLKKGAKISGSKFKDVNRTLKQPLPPASFQRFLRIRKDIPGVVLADHEFEFVNKYYNSRFDNGENVGIIGRSYGALPRNLTKLAETIANALYILASNGTEPSRKLVVPNNLTTDLLYCMLYSYSCPAFTEMTDGKGPGQIALQPYLRYVSIADQENPNTEIVRRLLMYYTGEWLPNCTGKDKTQARLPKALSYFTVIIQNGSSHNMSSICVKGTAYKTIAVSPAFELKQFESTEYSTWTESMWSSEMGIRMYLIADPSIEGIILACGIIMTLCSFGLVFFFKMKCTVLFTPMTAPVISISS